MRLSEQGFEELKKSEAYRKYAYPDVASPLFKAYPKKPWGFKPVAEILRTLPDSARKLDGTPYTVGYGQTVGVTPESQMTLAEAEDNLRAKIRKYELAVESSCTVEPTQGQFDALVQIAWNVMAAVSKDSSIIKAHNRRDWLSASRAFDLYNKARGKEDKGLTLRRKREGAAYLAASPVTEVEDITVPPQTVDAEKPMTKSEINIASVAAGGTAAVTAVTETVNAINAFKAGITTLSNWTIPVLLVAVVGLCIYIVVQRNTQRKQGWS